MKSIHIQKATLYGILSLAIFCTACQSTTTTDTANPELTNTLSYPPPIPQTEMTSSQTLQYIADSDQYDRSLINENDLLANFRKQPNVKTDTMDSRRLYQNGNRLPALRGQSGCKPTR